MTELDIVDRIAATLGETEEAPRLHIRRIVKTIGTQRAWGFVEKALEVEANGGLLLPNGRRRTLGGVFFYLVRHGVTDDEREVLFPTRKQKQKPGPHGDPAATEAPKISQFWLDFAAGKPLSYKWYAKRKA